MSTWEERMSQRAKAKGWAGTKTLGPDPHEGHETHNEGNTVRCSCGEFMGIFSIAIDAPVHSGTGPCDCWACSPDEDDLDS